MLRSIVEVDLVGSNAEAADHDQVLGLTEDFGSELGLGSDPDNVDIPIESQLAMNLRVYRRTINIFVSRIDSPDLLDQLVLWQRRLQGFHLVALLGQDVLTALIDILQQQNLDICGVEGDRKSVV